MAEMPGDDSKPEDLLKRSAFTCGAVRADRSVRGLETPLRGSHVGLKSALRSLEDLRESEQEKLAEVVQLDGEVDYLVNDFVGRLLLLVNKNYEHPLYRRYVPGSVRDITQADMRTEEPVLVTEMIKLMDEDKDKPVIGPLATEFIPRLQAANDLVIAAEKELSKVESDANHFENNTIPALMLEWKTEYKKVEAALTAQWPLDPERVQRCFKPFRKPKKKAKKDEPAKPTTADGTGTKTG